MVSKKPLGTIGLRRLPALRSLAVFTMLVLVFGVTPTWAAADKPSAGDKPVPSPRPPREPVPAGFSSWDEVMRLQQKLNKAADAITAGDPAGYAGIVADPLERELVVYWKGTPPPGTQETISRHRAGVPIRVLPAKYTQQKLLSEAERLIRDKDITSVAPLPDGSGLEVAVAGTAADAKANAALRSSPVPHTVREHVQPKATLGRWNDDPPWWGGGLWQGTTGQSFGCTVGFSVTIGGYKELLTAAHCGVNGFAAVTFTGKFIGETHGANYVRDTMLIFPPSGSQSVIYTGGLDALADPIEARAVIGAVTSYPGNLVCTSGAFSGERCNIRVTRVGLDIDVLLLGSIYTIAPVVEVEHQNRESAMGPGDSGGPVFEHEGPYAYAKGTMTAIDPSTATTCTGWNQGTSQCGWRGYYVDITESLSRYGATIP